MRVFCLWRFLFCFYTLFIQRLCAEPETLKRLLLFSCEYGLKSHFSSNFNFGWIGVPKLGVYGAAYATVFSTVLTFIIMIVYLRKKNHPLKFDSSISLKWTERC